MRWRSPNLLCSRWAHGVDAFERYLAVAVLSSLRLPVVDCRFGLEERKMDVAVVGVLVEPGVPNGLLGVEANGLKERRQHLLQKLPCLLWSTAVVLAILLLEADDTVPNDRLGFAEIIPQYLLLFLVDEAIVIEDSRRLLLVAGVGDVIVLIIPFLMNEFSRSVSSRTNCAPFWIAWNLSSELGE